MGTVIDAALNSFFGHHSSPGHPQHSAYREANPRSVHRSPTPATAVASSERSRSPPPSRARPSSHMSESGQRAFSSSAASRSTSSPSREQQRHVAATPQSAPRALSQVPRSHPAQQPSSSPVNARPTPSTAPGSQRAIALTAGAQPDSARLRPRKIKVRDLEHIQSFASEDMGSFSEIRSRSRSRTRGAEDDGPQYEISEMKVEHIIEMVAGLLTKITTTNDRQHEHLHRQPPTIDSAAHLNQQTSSVLAFHGKNVPSITILSYLSRINKYCPTSYEVFLSLLVYFDRMTERVNAGPMQSLREANQQGAERRVGGSSSESLRSDGAMEGVTATTPSGTQQVTPPHSGGMETSAQKGAPGTPHSRPTQPESPSIPARPSAIEPYNLSHFFVVDSFNIHRLVIAGVTCASKFFSDIFYTNSRYAKVGGLPLQELNHLELQFLLLNDFRLSVPVEEIEAYGTMLVEFYAREVVAQQQAAAAMQMRSLSESSNESTSTVRAVG